jgi:hypothetical protein
MNCTPLHEDKNKKNRKICEGIKVENEEMKKIKIYPLHLPSVLNMRIDVKREKMKPATALNAKRWSFPERELANTSSHSENALLL